MNTEEIYLLGGLALANFTLVMLLTRRVRSLELRRSSPRDLPRLSTGKEVQPFEAMAVDGNPVSLDVLRGRPSLVGFFSVKCQPCREQLPAFAQLANTLREQQNALAVIVGAEAPSDELAAIVDGAALLIYERRRGPVATAFSASAFPTIYRMDSQVRVEAAGHSVVSVMRTLRESASRP